MLSAISTLALSCTPCRVTLGTKFQVHSISRELKKELELQLTPTNIIFCLHYSTSTNNTTMFIYGRVGQPSHRAVYLTYMQICINIKYYINKRTEAPKPDTKTPKNQRVEKTRGTCTPDQCSGATLGVLGYASA